MIMNITHKARPKDLQEFQTFHIFTVAEVGFSMLDIYGRKLHGISSSQLQKFANAANDRDEMITLHPEAPITIMPKRFFRDYKADAGIDQLDGFKQKLRGFLLQSIEDIQANCIVLDWHVSAVDVPESILQATEEAFESCFNGEDDQSVNFNLQFVI